MFQYLYTLASDTNTYHHRSLCRDLQLGALPLGDQRQRHTDSLSHSASKQASSSSNLIACSSLVVPCLGTTLAKG